MNLEDQIKNFHSMFLADRIPIETFKAFLTNIAFDLEDKVRKEVQKDITEQASKLWDDK